MSESTSQSVERDLRAVVAVGTGMPGSTRTPKGRGTSMPAHYRRRRPVPAAWQPRVDEQFKLARSEDRHESHDAYAFDALVRGAVDGEETCEIAGLGPIPVRIARTLLGDAILELAITKGVDVANLTHQGWALVPGNGNRPMVPPDDPPPEVPHGASRGSDAHRPRVECDAARVVSGDA